VFGPALLILFILTDAWVKLFPQSVLNELSREVVEQYGELMLNEELNI
jgi:hypothetical protein